MQEIQCVRFLFLEILIQKMLQQLIGNMQNIKTTSSGRMQEREVESDEEILEVALDSDMDGGDD